MAPVSPTPLRKKQRKYNMTEVRRKRLQENQRNQAASNSVGGFQRMVADIIQVLFLYMECNHNQNEKATRSELSQYRLKEPYTIPGNLNRLHFLNNKCVHYFHVSMRVLYLL